MFGIKGTLASESAGTVNIERKLVVVFGETAVVEFWPYTVASEAQKAPTASRSRPPIFSRYQTIWRTVYNKTRNELQSSRLENKKDIAGVVEQE